MRRSVKTVLVALLGAASVAAAPAAWAGCGVVAPKKTAAWHGTPGSTSLTHSVFQAQGTSSPNLLGSDRGDFTAGRFQAIEYGENSIVGMWAFTMTAGGNPVDFGYSQWHSDGTELMNSGGRAPSTENFCMGVWKRTGPSRYHLNHFALSYDSTGTLNAKVNIKEDVTVDASGATYTGPFTLDVLDPKTGALLQHVAGQVTGQRVAAY